MADIQIPVDLGFTEFVTSLLSEVLQSVVAAQSDQEARRRELLEAVALSVDEFAALHVTDDDVEAWLGQLFPPTGEGRPHDAAAGTPYVPRDDGQPESPPYEAVLGVQLPRSAVSRDTGNLLGSGADRIAAAARTALAEQQLQVARDLAERGLPRVVVDSGKVTAKLTFEALQFRDPAARESEEEVDDGTEAAPIGPARLARRNPVVMAGKLSQLQRTAVLPQVLRDVRLRVHTVDDRSPETTTSRANVFGEVELTFRTIL